MSTEAERRLSRLESLAFEPAAPESRPEEDWMAESGADEIGRFYDQQRRGEGYDADEVVAAYRTGGYALVRELFGEETGRLLEQVVDRRCRDVGRYAIALSLEDEDI